MVERVGFVKPEVLKNEKITKNMMLHYNYGHLAIFAGNIDGGTGFWKCKYLCSSLQNEAT